MAEKKIAETAEEQKPLMEQYVRIKIPRENPNQENVIVWINDRRFEVRRGVPVDVPVPVARVLERSEAQKERAFEYMTAEQDKAREFFNM